MVLLRRRRQRRSCHRRVRFDDTHAAARLLCNGGGTRHLPVRVIAHQTHRVLYLAVELAERRADLHRHAMFAMRDPALPIGSGRGAAKARPPHANTVVHTALAVLLQHRRALAPAAVWVLKHRALTMLCAATARVRARGELRPWRQHTIHHLERHV